RTDDPSGQGRGSPRRRVSGWRLASTRSAASLGVMVRMIRRASEDEVIAAFLQAEIDSDRHAAKILKELQADGWPQSSVDSPNLGDPEENAYRRSLLGRLRGWGRGEG